MVGPQIISATLPITMIQQERPNQGCHLKHHAKQVMAVSQWETNSLQVCGILIPSVLTPSLINIAKMNVLAGSIKSNNGFREIENMLIVTSFAVSSMMKLPTLPMTVATLANFTTIIVQPLIV